MLKNVLAQLPSARALPLALALSMGIYLDLSLGLSMGAAHAQQAVQVKATDWLQEAARRLDDAPVVRGDFEQTKSIKGFKKPLVSRGRFVMAKGRGLQWITTEPFPSTLTVTRERLTTQTEGGTQQLDTRQEPGLRAVNELLMAVLAGDMQALSTRFQVEGGLQGAQGWRMSLVPKDAALARFIARIEMEGDRYVQHVRLSEASGDESRIRFMQHGTAPLNQAESDRFK